MFPPQQFADAEFAVAVGQGEVMLTLGGIDNEMAGDRHTT
jgi:hypothetical protein